MALNPLWLVGGVSGVLGLSLLALLWPAEEPAPPPPRPPAPSLKDFLPEAPPAPAVVTVPGRLVVEPAALDVRLDALEPPAQRRLVVRNDGGAPLAITAVEIVGTSTAAIESHTCGEMPPGAVCTVEVAIRPVGDGRSDATVLLVSSTGEPLRVPVQIDVRLPRAVAEAPAVPPPVDADAVLAAELRRLALEARRPASLVHRGDPRAIAAGPRSAARVAGSDAGAPATWRSVEDAGPRDLSLVVPAGAFIPLVLVHAVNTELDSRFVAQVSRPVYGGAGARVVLPAGTRVLGEVVLRGRDEGNGGAPSPSGTRVAVRALRLLAPDGRSWTLGGEAVADAMGRQGMVGQVDSRRSDKFWLAGLVSVLGNGAQVAAAAAAGGGTTVTDVGNRTVVQQDALSGALGEAGAGFAADMSRITETLLEERERERDVVQVAAGSRLHLVPMVDLVLHQPPADEAVVAVVGGRGTTVEQGGAADAAPVSGAPSGAGSRAAPAPAGETFLDRGYLTPADLGRGQAVAPPQSRPPEAVPLTRAPPASSIPPSRQVTPPGFGGPGDLRPQPSDP